MFEGLLLSWMDIWKPITTQQEKVHAEILTALYLWAMDHRSNTLPALNASYLPCQPLLTKNTDLGLLYNHSNSHGVEKMARNGKTLPGQKADE